MSETQLITNQQLVAHRGYQRRFPENTALSVLEAISAGALFIEIDIPDYGYKYMFFYHIKKYKY